MSHRRLSNSSRSGFTLVEMLVTLGIIVALISVLVSAVFSARRASERQRNESDLLAIAQGLAEYNTQFRAFPKYDVYPSGAPRRGVLAWALIGPFPATSSDEFHDGCDGVGFRTIYVPASGGNPAHAGEKYGPYIPADKFRFTNNNTDLVDRYGTMTIEYIPRVRAYKPGMVLFGSGTATNYCYNTADMTNSGCVAYLRKAMGDSNCNNTLDAGESFNVPPFLLISAGVDKVYSNQTDVINSFTRCDEAVRLGPP